jgi:hypothetical protein
MHSCCTACTSYRAISSPWTHASCWTAWRPYKVGRVLGRTCFGCQLLDSLAPQPGSPRGLWLRLWLAGEGGAGPSAARASRISTVPDSQRPQRPAASGRGPESCADRWFRTAASGRGQEPRPTACLPPPPPPLLGPPPRCSPARRGRTGGPRRPAWPPPAAIGKRSIVRLLFRAREGRFRAGPRTHRFRT